MSYNRLAKLPILNLNHNEMIGKIVLKKEIVMSFFCKPVAFNFTLNCVKGLRITKNVRQI